MNVEKLVVGQLATNCYLVYDEYSKECLIIDPGEDADFIERKIFDLKLKPEMIVVTHGHFDHVLGVTELRLAYGIPFLMHEADLFLLKRTVQTAKHFLKIDVLPLLPPDQFLKDGDFLTVGSVKLKVMETPGHTPGSVSLMRQKSQKGQKGQIFCGDLLFADGMVGRTDFAYSSRTDLEKSLKKISRSSGGGAIIYPGHGEDFESPSN